ncbi:MAG: RNA polymerase sigma factor [Bacteroidetes bacterium]|nr:RNA polymerase sigma factor [Bacteroidota bacterium]
MAAARYKETDDAVLINASLEGDSQAFSEIVNRYKNMVARTVKGMIGDNMAAEDVGQEVFIKLYYSLKQFRGDSKLSTYIHRIAVNLTLNEIKKIKRAGTTSHDDNIDSLRVTHVSGDDQVERNETKELVEKALQLLEPKYRSVMVMRMLQGYDTRETADTLGLPVGTVLSRLSRAQEQMRNILKKL